MRGLQVRVLLLELFTSLEGRTRSFDRVPFLLKLSEGLLVIFPEDDLPSAFLAPVIRHVRKLGPDAPELPDFSFQFAYLYRHSVCLHQRPRSSTG